MWHYSYTLHTTWLVSMIRQCLHHIRMFCAQRETLHSRSTRVAERGCECESVGRGGMGKGKGNMDSDVHMAGESIINRV